ncbi:acetate--CoA ligase [Sulfolobus acidocaldarius]|uniref:Acetate--CoA ligase n=4 Tax=Sulfolobus acidocaldarius TaxID=2285 RepID=Q4JBV7_SULAC|nr:acetate--CoA ligase [Sulfolobus acidocaldarius]AAY79722.1 acetyl-coenzyme A synthetase [Sulfolobus acidocaldarius DSM 639]AGE70281.1 acetyl-CoA synthetase [Sulfolobus acidocaldarius N8]AGE72556.1 acetyl-CoA synthetase [Sulfolobus acidocaldarius Ron12/I]ALU29318.1 acetyl-coenzyme A synthetase [Sulfolobus acidocaldarius]ALU32047.1 acetyl-coenzyme A synthetase [Sulfolobus acidocaldarius]
MSVSWALPFEQKIIPKKGASKLVDINTYKEIHSQTVKEYRNFWASVASELEWFKPWEKVLDDSNPPFYKWFVGGEINASYLAVDRHAKSWRKNKVAILWEGEPVDERGNPKEVRKLTYHDLYKEVNRVAYLLKEKYKLKKGDTIAIYLPMIPELPIFMLAAARLGVVFTVVFSGFSADALANRINDAEAKLVVTADGGWRRGKIVELKQIVDKALEKTPTVKDVIVVRRTGHKVNMMEGRDKYFDEVIKDIPQNVYVEPERLKSEDPLYILYTSGTTGKPKGIVHDIGGYETLLHATMRWVFDIRDDDIYWCTADIGWVTGHSYIVFGPLTEGATTVMYEGALDYPQPDRWVSIIERHSVTILYTSPTAIRTFMKFGEEWVKKHDTSTVRLIHSVGEPINPEAQDWMWKLVGREEIPFGSTWWMTETGGIMISHLPGLYLIPMKPGTNGMPIMGVEADVVNDDGKPSNLEDRGYLVIKNPWPGMPLTIYKDPERYVKVYWSKFPGMFYAGDYAVKDRDGYFWILGRADEVIKVSGHRLGTYELESALIEHPAVAEAAVVGVPDPVKGEVPYAFVVLRSGQTPSQQLTQEILKTVREKVGPIAVVDKVFFVSKLPKTRSGKIMRRVVKAVVTKAEVGDITTLEDEASVDEVKKAYEEFKAEVGKSS